MSLDRIRVTWTGSAVVGGGISTFYMDPAVSTGPGDLLAFFTAIKSGFPTTLTWTVPSSGDTIDEATGKLTGSWAHTGGGSVVGTGSGPWAMGVGSRVKWTTAGLVGGRRVRGETFLVPLITLAYDGTGQVAPATQGIFITAAGNLVLTHPGQFFVWTRPKGTAPGTKTAFLGAIVPPQVSTLRSRRV